MIRASATRIACLGLGRRSGHRCVPELARRTSVTRQLTSHCLVRALVTRTASQRLHSRRVPRRVAIFTRRALCARKLVLLILEATNLAVAALTVRVLRRAHSLVSPRYAHSERVTHTIRCLRWRRKRVVFHRARRTVCRAVTIRLRSRLLRLVLRILARRHRLARLVVICAGPRTACCRW